MNLPDELAGNNSFLALLLAFQEYGHRVIEGASLGPSF
jgi:hypothetical protein